MIDSKGWNDLAAVQNQLGEKNNLLIIMNCIRSRKVLFE